MSKSSQIVDLYARGLARGEDPAELVREIALIVDCRPEYVRVCARQRKGRGASDIDLRYLATPKGQLNERKRKQGHRHFMATVYATADKRQAQQDYTRVYRVARSTGRPIREAKRAARAAWSRRIYETGDRQSASVAAKVARDSFALEAAE